MAGSFDKPPAKLVQFDRNKYWKNRLPFRPALGQPAMSEPATPETNPVPISPTGKPVMPQVVTVILTVLAVLAGGVAAVGSAGVALPPVVVGIAASVSALCAAFGIASPGIRSALPK
jgi:hypothetical protein